MRVGEDEFISDSLIKTLLYIRVSGRLAICFNYINRLLATTFTFIVFKIKVYSSGLSRNLLYILRHTRNKFLGTFYAHVKSPPNICVR